MALEVQKEKGIIYVEQRTLDISGLWIPLGAKPFYYEKIVWIDTLKFAFGSWESFGKLTHMVEVSTGGVASHKGELSGSVTVEKLMDKYKEKLISHGASCGELVVENFKSKFTIQLWQINLWAF